MKVAYFYTFSTALLAVSAKALNLKMQNDRIGLEHG